MATGTVATVARQYHTQQVHFIRFDVAYNDAGVASGKATGEYLPAGAIIIGTDVFVNAVFNAGSTNVLTVGTNGSTANNIVASGDVNEASAILFKDISPAAGGTAEGKLASDAQIYVKFDQTGTAAATGSATVMIKYIPDL